MTWPEFYLSPSRAWEFAAGALLATTTLKPVRPALASAAAAAGLVAISATFVLLPP